MPMLSQLILAADGLSVGDLRSGLDAGANAVTGTYQRELIHALRELHREFDFEVYPIVPNAPQYVRDLADLGMAQAALRRLFRLPPRAWLRLAAYGLANMGRVWAQDFRAMLGVMVHLELPAFAPFQPPVVFLHAQLTDLLLACGNASAFSSFTDLVRRYGAKPGLETRNFGHLLPRLDEWGVDVPFIAAPFNPQGFSMRPSKEVCLRLLEQTDRTVVAWAGRSSNLEKTLEYLRGGNIRAAILGPPFS